VDFDAGAFLEATSLASITIDGSPSGVLPGQVYSATLVFNGYLPGATSVFITETNTTQSPTFVTLSLGEAAAPFKLTISPTAAAGSTVTLSATWNGSTVSSSYPVVTGLAVIQVQGASLGGSDFEPYDTGRADVIFPTPTLPGMVQLSSSNADLRVGSAVQGSSANVVSFPLQALDPSRVAPFTLSARELINCVSTPVATATGEVEADPGQCTGKHRCPPGSAWDPSSCQCESNQ
jgi:hypothetical protein